MPEVRARNKVKGVVGVPPWTQLQILIAELEGYQYGLSLRPALVVANKMDEEAASENLRRLRQLLTCDASEGGWGNSEKEGVPIVEMCAVLGEGADELREQLCELVKVEPRVTH